MRAEHHATTIQHWDKRASLSFRQETAPRGRAGSRTTFGTLVARAKQRWLFVEPCMREPLRITPPEHGSHPHFKLPPAQGWALKRFDNEVTDLELKEAKHMAYQRRRDGLDLDLQALADRSTNTEAAKKPAKRGISDFWLLHKHKKGRQKKKEREAAEDAICSSRPATPPPSAVQQQRCQI